MMDDREIAARLLSAAANCQQAAESLREVYKALAEPSSQGRTYELAEIAAIHIGAFGSDLRGEADAILQDATLREFCGAKETT